MLLTCTAAVDDQDDKHDDQRRAEQEQFVKDTGGAVEEGRLEHKNLDE